MKTAKSIIIVLFVLLAAQIASAYYCPSTGRWLSRDPIGERGFQTAQMASVAPRSPQLASSRWINRDPINEISFGAETNWRIKFSLIEEFNQYKFANNDGINKYDKLGNKCCLLTWGPHWDSNRNAMDVGHSALKCDNAYVSAWPNGSGPAGAPGNVDWHNSQSEDDAEEGRQPDSSVCSSCIDQDNVAAWLTTMTASPQTWSIGANCADYTQQAIIAGLDPKASRQICCPPGQVPYDIMGGSFPLNTAASVNSALNELNGNGCNRNKCRPYRMPPML